MVGFKAVGKVTSRTCMNTPKMDPQHLAWHEAGDTLTETHFSTRMQRKSQQKTGCSCSRQSTCWSPIISDVNVCKWENDARDDLYFAERNIHLLLECAPEMRGAHFKTCFECNPFTPHLNTQKHIFYEACCVVIITETAKQTWDRDLTLLIIYSLYIWAFLTCYCSIAFK